MTFFKSLLTFSVFKNNLYWTQEQLEKLFSLTWLWSFQLHCDPGKMWFGFQRSWCSDDWRLDDSFHQTPWLDPQSALPLPGPQGQAQKTADLLLKKQQQKSPDKRTVWKQYFTPLDVAVSSLWGFTFVFILLTLPPWLLTFLLQIGTFLLSFLPLLLLLQLLPLLLVFAGFPAAWTVAGICLWHIQAPSILH